MSSVKILFLTALVVLCGKLSNGGLIRDNYENNYNINNAYATNAYDSNAYATNDYVRNDYATNDYAKNLHVSNVYVPNVYASNVYGHAHLSKGNRSIKFYLLISSFK